MTRKATLLCIVSAGIGSLLTVLTLRLEPQNRLVAQEVLPRLQETAGPALVNDPRALRGPNLERLPGDDGLTPEERVSVAVYENCNRGVVNINTKVVRNDTFSLFEVPSEGAGSGSVLDVQGHILTNFHVIDSAREIQVTLYDGKSYEGRLVGKDESNDVAVLKIDAPVQSLHPLIPGDSQHLKVGQRVYAIGNPFGLERTLTTGIVSSLERTLPARNRRTIKSIIQIDAAINPGNSGGPLLDSHGRLIGMNTAIASSTGQSAGVGFAIPIANIVRIVPQLIERGHVIRADAGVARVLQTEKGLLIVTMTTGGPAELAGLRGFRVVKQKKRQGPFTYETQTIDRSSADLIIAVDHQPAIKATDFLNLIEVKRPGDEAVITVVREGRETDVRVRLAAVDS
jgi:S1-C subfamily serine protease